MKSLKHLTVITALFFFLSCNNDDNNNGNEPSSIKIGSYIFNFETEFTLEELQGIDSYVGNIKGSGISLFFDYKLYLLLIYIILATYQDYFLLKYQYLSQ